MTDKPGPSASAEPPAVPPLRGRAARRLLIGLGLAGLVVAVAWGAVQAVAWWRLEAALAEADRLDPGGWRVADLFLRQPEVEEAENPAGQVELVLEFLPDGWPAPPDPELAPIGEFPAADESAPRDAGALLDVIAAMPPRTEMAAALGPVLDTEVDALAYPITLAARLAETGPGRFPRPFTPIFARTDLAHLRDVRVVLDLLRLEAAHAAGRGEPDGALAAARAMLGLSRAIGDEPISASQLTRAQCHAAAVATLGRALAAGEPSPGALAALRADLDLAAEAPLLRLAVDAERASADDLMGRLEQGDPTAAFFAGFDRDTPPDPTAMRLYLLAFFRLNRAILLEWNNTASVLSRLPFDEARPDWDSFLDGLDEDQGPVGRLAHLLRPPYRTIVRALARDQAMLRSARVAVAVERHRLDRGSWPDSLDALVPDYLAAVPGDPFRDAPLGYRRLPDGVVIYSMGPAGQDDGGAMPGAGAAGGDDLGVRLWDATLRLPGGKAAPPPPR